MSEAQPGVEGLQALGLAFSQLREERGSSVEALAASTGIRSSRIEALELGSLDPDYDLLLTLARGLGVEPKDLVIRAEAITASSSAEAEDR